MESFLVSSSHAAFSPSTPSPHPQPPPCPPPGMPRRRGRDGRGRSPFPEGPGWRAERCRAGRSGRGGGEPRGRRLRRGGEEKGEGADFSHLPRRKSIPGETGGGEEEGAPLSRAPRRRRVPDGAGKRRRRRPPVCHFQSLLPLPATAAAGGTRHRERRNGY